MIRSPGVLIALGLILTTAQVMADDPHKGQINILSHGWGAAGAPSPGKNDGGYVLTDVQHQARPSSLGSLQSLGSSNDLFGARGAGAAPQGASGTGKTMDSRLLGKQDGTSPGANVTLTEGSGYAAAQAMGDSSVRSIKDTISPPSGAKPSGGAPAGTVMFKVDGPASAAGGAAKGAVVPRR